MKYRLPSSTLTVNVLRAETEKLVFQFNSQYLGQLLDI